MPEAPFSDTDRRRKKRAALGVAECQLTGTLCAEELERLKEYITAQVSGERGMQFSDFPIEVETGELYIYFWNEEDWHIQAEQERFAPAFAEGLPALCFSTLPSTGDLICIKRGESGYYPSDWNTDDHQKNKELADYNNQRLGVTVAQRQAMECGSMHGWSVPGADPGSYEQDAQKNGGINPCQTM